MRPSAATHLGAAAVTLAAMVATPSMPVPVHARRGLSSVVVGGLAMTTASSTLRRRGPVRTGLAAASTMIVTTAIEHLGQRTGRPFGRYEYTPALRPKIVGVPVHVPLAWFAMALPTRETAHAALGQHSTPFRRIIAGAGALAAWDLFLDPQMVGEGYWRWTRSGAYRGIPLSNFGGWFATGMGVMMLLEVTVPAEEPAADLVAQYGLMAALETVAFAAFFRDRLVAAVGGAAMLPIAALAVRGLVGQRP